MTNSQKELFEIALQCEKRNDIDGAISNLEEALRLGYDGKVTVKLSELYRMQDQKDQAYLVMKMVPDLFSDKTVFEEYAKVLQENNFLIEALQLKNLSSNRINLTVKPADLSEQRKIIKEFQAKTVITQTDYLKLFKLDLPTYLTFCKSLLLNITQSFAIRLTICEDLIKLGIKEEIPVIILGKEYRFVPVQTCLLKKNTIYQDVISIIYTRYNKEPNKLPLMLGEANLSLGSLYPMIDKFIDDAREFTNSLISFLDNGQGFSYDNLLQKIYKQQF